MKTRIALLALLLAATLSACTSSITGPEAPAQLESTGAERTEIPNFGGGGMGSGH